MSGSNRFLLVTIGLAGLVVALFVASLLQGPVAIPPGRAAVALFTDDGGWTLVMREIRLPRALLAVTIGASLGLSGAALQGYLRNPLADAGVLGVGASAALGAVLALYTGLSTLFPLALPFAGLAGAIVAVVLVLALSGREAGSVVLILSGVAVSGLAGALTSLVLNLSPNPYAALEIVFWLLGSLADRSMLHVGLALPFMLVGWVLLAATGRGLDALTLGRDTALSLGIRMDWLRLAVVLGTAAAVGAGVAVAGSIGFVGLVVPHLLRPLVGSRPSRLLAASALGGAALLTAADLAARVISPDRDLKLGVVTALVGTPFFLALVIRAKGKFA
jgi:iron complex transport system permease protein